MQRFGLRPGKPLFGTLPVPASKSHGQRALLIAALCREPVWIAGLPAQERCADDLRHARQWIENVGARVDAPLGTSLRVRGLAPGPMGGWRAAGELELGESGTLARLGTAAAALCARPGGEIRLVARGSLSRRTSPGLMEALRSAGVRMAFRGIPDGFTLSLWPIGPPSRIELWAPSSSQEVSGLLVAAAAWPDQIEILVHGTIPSEPYVSLTISTLLRFGVSVERRLESGRTAFLVRGPLRAPEGMLIVEPDASAAAVLLAAACISRGRIAVPGLGAGSLQGDVAMVEHLRAFGCDAGFDSEGMFGGGPVTRGAQIDASGTPDLAPLLAALAADAALRCGQWSRLLGLATLQGKESPRISVLSEALSLLGLDVRADESSLEIAPGSSCTGAVELDPRGDHRMVFAFALLGLLRDGVSVLDPECVAKSWPGFWDDMQRAGGSSLDG